MSLCSRVFRIRPSSEAFETCVKSYKNLITDSVYKIHNHLIPSNVSTTS